MINFYKNNTVNLSQCFDVVYSRKFLNIQNINRAKQLIILPNTIIILLNLEEKKQLNLQEEINLNNIISNKNDSNDNIYVLVSMVCKIGYNKNFLCYCFIEEKGIWIGYKDHGIFQAILVESNSVPLLLVYQKKNKFIILIKFNKIYL